MNKALRFGKVFFVLFIILSQCKKQPADNTPETIPPETSTVTDIDGNTYQTVKIGDQWWMSENLKVTHYRNGDPVPNVTDPTEWTHLTTGAYCIYDNDSSHVATYGRLYNWYAVDDTRNIAPVGWHVPTDGEWKELEMFLGMSQQDAAAVGWRGADAGQALKGSSLWSTIPHTGNYNETGFTALPGGYRDSYDGHYEDMPACASFWSSTENYYEGSDDVAWCRMLYSRHVGVRRLGRNMQDGMSVRCVKN
jgi:uncharacterized protein (TIGR02145 family)